MPLSQAEPDRLRRRAVRRWLMPAAKLGIFALLVWGLWGALGEALVQLQRNPPQLRFGWLALSGVLYLLGEFPQALFWYSGIRTAGQPVSLGRAMYAFYCSQAGKYAPGKALVIVLRAAVLRMPGVETTVVVASCFIETLAAIAVGAGLAAVILATADWSGLWNDRQRMLLFLTAVGIFAATGVPTIPKVFQLLIRCSGAGHINPHAAAKVGAIPLRVLVIGAGGMVLGWAIQGLSLWATLEGLGQDMAPFDRLHWHTAAVSLAVGAGFVTLLPGGIGGREFVHIAMLKHLYHEPVPAVSAIVLRLVWLLSEVLVSIILYCSAHFWGIRTRGPLVAQSQTIETD